MPQRPAANPAREENDGREEPAPAPRCGCRAAQAERPPGAGRAKAQELPRPQTCTNGSRTTRATGVETPPAPRPTSARGARRPPAHPHPDKSARARARADVGRSGTAQVRAGGREGGGRTRKGTGGNGSGSRLIPGARFRREPTPVERTQHKLMAVDPRTMDLGLPLRLVAASARLRNHNPSRQEGPRRRTHACSRARSRGVAGAAAASPSAPRDRSHRLWQSVGLSETIACRRWLPLRSRDGTAAHHPHRALLAALLKSCPADGQSRYNVRCVRVRCSRSALCSRRGGHATRGSKSGQREARRSPEDERGQSVGR